MFLVLLSLRRPVTILILVLALALGAGLALRRAPVDIFPNLGVPVIYVVQPYGGMSPSQMEGQIVSYYEYHFLYVSGIEHIESQAIQGMAMLKLYFHPGTDIAQATAQVTAMAFRATAFMPPGTLPPFIVRYDAGSIPVGQLVFSSATHSESEVQDLALNRVRPLLATLPGVSAPPPSGGRVRTIVVYLDPERLRAYRLAPDDVAQALARGNLTLPAGNVRIGDLTTIAGSNVLVARPADLGELTLRAGPGPTVRMRDVGSVEDSADVVYNIALLNGRRTVYMPITKRADASTVAVVESVKAALPRMQEQLPPDVHVRFTFDQSVFVLRALRSLALEGVLGAAFAGLSVLLFLRAWREALIVLVIIPFSLLAAVLGLRLCGQTINIMTLGGLALAVGVLVDEATVAVENIHSHLARNSNTAQAVRAAMAEVMAPRLLALLCVVAVFTPVFSLVGIGRALFPPLALAVTFAMVASFVLSSTLVPVLAVWLLRGRAGAAAGHGRPERLRPRYEALCRTLLGHRALVLVGYLALCAGLLVLGGRLGVELFPRADMGQLRLRVRAPDGTRLERTEEIVRAVERAIHEELGAGAVTLSLANIGNPPWSYPVNAIYTWNSGPHEAVLLLALRPGRRAPQRSIEAALRRRLGADFPGVRFSLEPGDVVSEVLNFGAPAAVQVTVSGNALRETRAHAEKIAAALQRLPGLRDVQIPLALAYPSLDVQIDRERVGLFSETVEHVGRSLLAATASSVLTTPNFWVNPQTGIPYRVAVRVPERKIKSAADLEELPVSSAGAPRPLLGDVATVRQGTTPGEYDHLNSQRTINVTANLAGDDLGRAAQDVEQALRSVGAPPRGVTVLLRGQVQQLRTTLSGLQEGLLLAVVAVLLLLCASFQGLREALLAVAMVPGVLGGVVLALFVSRTTLNVQSLLGAIMAIGVATANSVLLLTRWRELRQAGEAAAAAALHAASARLRPILMTSLAMCAGMVPMTLGFGEGGEQSAPLGRAVLGGLVASTLATLLVLPVLAALGARGGPLREASLLEKAEGER